MQKDFRDFLGCLFILSSEKVITGTKYGIFVQHSQIAMSFFVTKSFSCRLTVISGELYNKVEALYSFLGESNNEDN